MDTPRIGSLVLFHTAVGGIGPVTAIPAIVAGIDSRADEVLLHLVTFNPLSGVSLHRGLPVSHRGDGEGQWAWPLDGAEAVTGVGGGVIDDQMDRIDGDDVVH